MTLYCQAGEKDLIEEQIWKWTAVLKAWGSLLHSVEKAEGPRVKFLFQKSHPIGNWWSLVSARSRRNIWRTSHEL